MYFLQSKGKTEKSNLSWKGEKDSKIEWSLNKGTVPFDKINHI
jgi:hypothetical protein